MAVRKKSPPPPNLVLDCVGKVVSLMREGQIVEDRRIGESSLAKTLKTSRTTIRAALQHLEMAGLVVRVPRSGTFLRKITVREFCDVIDIRASLEALAARLAATRTRDHDAQDLQIKARRVDDLTRRFFAERDGSAMFDLAQRDLEFHLSIAELSGNSRLVSVLKQQRLIEFTFALSQDPAAAGRSHKLTPTHLEIADAIASRDAAGAEKLIRRHILRTKEARAGVTGETA